jgi:hypothetical protein
MDEQLGQVVERFTAVSATARLQIQEGLLPAHRALFGLYGHRSATLAARTETAVWLRNGLVGNVIANYEIPERRRVEVSLAVFHHVARKLLLNPIDLFEDTAVYATPAYAAILLVFARRTDITLNQYGWQEQKTPEGIKYKFMYG